MVSLGEKKRELKSLIPDQGINPTIKYLKEFLLEQSEKFESLILIESHFREVVRNQQQGTLSFENGNIEKNKIRKKLLAVISDLKVEDTVLCVTGFLFTDPRDGQEYSAIRMKDKNIWMTENLNFDVGEGCWFYEDNPENGKQYGRLYNWDAAMKACPPGWHLPSDHEWKNLAKSYGGYDDSIWARQIIGDPTAAYSALINMDSKFNATLGGRRDVLEGDPKKGRFLQLESDGFYWTKSSEDDSPHRICFVFNEFGELERMTFGKSSGRSCRCIKVHE